tara:strand:+ start:169 stop:1161 length:993 start_codon:yes stop_codon:yes gene_type:complete
MFDDTDYSLYDGIPKAFRYIRNKSFHDWEIPPWDLIIHKDKMIGKGEFGTVYLASWKQTQVVAKIMNETLIETKKKIFNHEFDALSKCHHPHIVQLLGYVEDPFIIVMEYLPKCNLLHYIETNTLQVNEKIDICLDVLKGVEYLHSRRPHSIIHRDLKPQNIILSQTKMAKIGDFGLSKIIQSSNDPKMTIVNSHENILSMDTATNLEKEEQEENTSRVGTTRYMSPELKNGSIYNQKIDIWALGIMFAELFENKRHNNEFFWSKTPTNIQNLIVQYMLRNDPNDRLSAIDLIHSFRYVQHELARRNTCSSLCETLCKWSCISNLHRSPY